MKQGIIKNFINIITWINNLKLVRNFKIWIFGL